MPSTTRSHGRRLAGGGRGSGDQAPTADPGGRARERRTRHRTSRRAPRRRLLAATAGLLALCVATAPSAGQTEPIVLDRLQELAFDRPESWALKYYSSLSLLTGLGMPEETRPGRLELAFEGGLVPTLGEEKRRVGFIGTKVEDLNRSGVFGRARLTVGLGRDFSLTVGATPPVEVDGVTPRLLSVALGRPLHEGRRWRAGLRLLAQSGVLEGDLTCPRDIAGLDDSRRNPDACSQPSADEVTLSYLGFEASAGPKMGDERWRPYVSLLASHFDLEFQVRALYSVFDDRTRLESEGLGWALTAGTDYRVDERFRAAVELFYAPLSVVRDPLAGRRNDELVNLRALVAYTWR